MTNVGDSNALVTNSGWILKQGTDQYILKNTLNLDLSRPRIRDAIASGPVNTFGAGDHSLPCEFEADITKSINWANLNARDQLTGFLPNLPYTLTMQSKAVVASGTLPVVTVTITDGKISGTTISSPGSDLTSVILTVGDSGQTRDGKIVGIISEGILTNVIVTDTGEGYTGTPTVTETEVTSPFVFAFNAEVGDISFSQSESEGRVKIDANLIITDDAIEPLDA